MTTTMGVEPDIVHFIPDAPREWQAALARSLYLIAFGVSPVAATLLLGKDLYLILAFSVPIGIIGLLGLSEVIRARKTLGYELYLDEWGLQVSRPQQGTAKLPWDKFGGYRWRVLGSLERFIHPERGGIELLGHEGSVLLFFPIPPVLRSVEPQLGRYRSPKSCALAAALAHLRAQSDSGLIPVDSVVSAADLKRKVLATSAVAVLVGVPGWTLMVLVLRHWQTDEPIPASLSGFADSRVFWLPVLAALTATALAMVALVAAVTPKTQARRNSERAPTELSLHFARTGGKPADLAIEGQYHCAATAEVEPRLRSKVKGAKPGLVIVSVLCLGFPALFVVSAATGNQTATFGVGVGIFGMFFTILVLAFGGYWVDSNFLINMEDTITADETGVVVQRSDGSSVRFSRAAKLLRLGTDGTEILVENGQRYVLRRALLQRSDG